MTAERVVGIEADLGVAQPVGGLDAVGRGARGAVAGLPVRVRRLGLDDLLLRAELGQRGGVLGKSVKV